MHFAALQRISVALSAFSSARQALDFEDVIDRRTGHFAEVDGNDIGMGEITYWLYCNSAKYVARMLEQVFETHGLMPSSVTYRKAKWDEYRPIEE